MISSVHVLSFYLHPDSLVFQPVDITLCYVVDFPVDQHHGGHIDLLAIFAPSSQNTFLMNMSVNNYTEETIQMNLDMFI